MEERCGTLQAECAALGAAAAKHAETARVSEKAYCWFTLLPPSFTDEQGSFPWHIVSQARMSHSAFSILSVRWEGGGTLWCHPSPQLSVCDISVKAPDYENT